MVASLAGRSTRLVAGVPNAGYGFCGKPGAPSRVPLFGPRLARERAGVVLKYTSVSCSILSEKPVNSRMWLSLMFQSSLTSQVGTVCDNEVLLEEKMLPNVLTSVVRAYWIRA